MLPSKLTRVRSDFFSNTIAITRPGRSASRSPLRNLALRSSLIEKIRSTSAGNRSVMARKCRIAAPPSGQGVGG